MENEILVSQPQNVSEIQFLDTAQLAERLRVSRHYARKLLREEKIEAKKFGRQWRTTTAAIERYYNNL